jgi:hypothetical protein
MYPYTMFQQDKSRLFKLILRKGFKKGRLKNCTSLKTARLPPVGGCIFGHCKGGDSKASIRHLLLHLSTKRWKRLSNRFSSRNIEPYCRFSDR